MAGRPQADSMAFDWKTPMYLIHSTADEGRSVGIYPNHRRTTAEPRRIHPFRGGGWDHSLRDSSVSVPPKSGNIHGFSRCGLSKGFGSLIPRSETDRKFASSQPMSASVNYLLLVGF